MLQVFYLDVAKVDLDVAYAYMLQTYVSNVFMCFIRITTTQNLLRSVCKWGSEVGRLVARLRYSVAGAAGPVLASVNL
jgi:hypothetical protein